MSKNKKSKDSRQKLLKILKNLKSEWHIAMEDAFEDAKDCFEGFDGFYLQYMDDIQKAAYEEGIEEGIKIGREEATKAAYEKGLKEGQKMLVERLLDKVNRQ